MDHVGVIVDDLAGAIEFFTALGLEVQGRFSVGGAEVDRIVGLEGVENDAAMMQTPDGHSKLELIQFNAPPAEGDAHGPANTRGLRHLCFAVDDIEAEVAKLRANGFKTRNEIMDFHSRKLVFIEGPEGVTVGLSQWH